MAVPDVPVSKNSARDIHPEVGPGAKTKSFDIWRFALRRGPFILVVGALLFVILAPVLLLRVSPGYRAETFLMVTPAKQPTLAGRDRDVIPGDLKDYMRTLAHRIAGYDILQDALERIPPAEWPAFLDPVDPMPKNVFRVMKRLRANELSGTFLLEVYIEAGDPKGLGELVNAIARSFLNRLAVEQELQYGRSLDYLKVERDNILSRIEEQRLLLIELANTAGQKAFLHEAYSAHLTKLQLLQEHFWAAEARRVEREEEYNRAKSNSDGVRLLSMKPEAEKAVADNFGINRMEQWTYEKLQELRASIDGLTAENQERVYVEARMTAMDEYLKQYRADVQDTTLKILTDKRAYQMDAEIVQAAAGMNAASQSVAYFKGELTLAAAEASRISEIIFNAQAAIFTIEQLRMRLAALDSRIDDNEIQAKSPLPVTIDREARSPEKPFESNKKKLLLMAFVLSFGFVFGICLLFDFLDGRVRTVRDIEKALGGPAPEPVPLLELADGQVDADTFKRISLDAPESPAAQAIRGLAIRLLPEKERYGATVFLLCGTEHGAGVSDMTLNLGTCLAAYHGRVLLLDVSKPADVPWETTVHAVASLARHDDERNLDRLAVGSVPDRIPPVACIASLLTELRQDYDWILIDGSPLLEDDLTQAVAQHADGILLIIREDKNQYSDLRKTIDLLMLYRVPALTAVLNGARYKPANWAGQALAVVLDQLTRYHRILQQRARSLKKWLVKT